MPGTVTGGPRLVVKSHSRSQHRGKPPTLEQPGSEFGVNDSTTVLIFFLKAVDLTRHSTRLRIVRLRSQSYHDLAKVMQQPRRKQGSALQPAIFPHKLRGKRCRYAVLPQAVTIHTGHPCRPQTAVTTHDCHNPENLLEPDPIYGFKNIVYGLGSPEIGAVAGLQQFGGEGGIESNQIDDPTQVRIGACQRVQQ